MINCILCGKEQTKFLGELKPQYDWVKMEGNDDKFDIYDCETCGARFAYPNSIQPKFYDFIFDQTSIYKGQLEFARTLRQQDDPSWALMALGHPYYGVFEFLKGKKNLDILDLGCSYGYLTYVLNLMGHRTIGIDVSRQAVYFAKGVFGDTFFQMDIEELVKNNPQLKCDVIIAIEVIEHLEKPMQFVQTALKCLKDKGHFIITTPNKDFKHLMEDRAQMHANDVWMADHPPVHLSLFGKQAMEYIAKENNLSLSFIIPIGLAEQTGSLNLIAVFQKNET